MLETKSFQVPELREGNHTPVHHRRTNGLIVFGMLLVNAGEHFTV